MNSSSPLSPPINRHDWKWCVWVLLATFLFTLMIVNMSFLFGRLKYPPGYDDVLYFNEGHTLVTAFQEKGIPGVIRSFIQTPPHSFYSSVTAALGFLIFGEKEWVPYMMNWGILILFLGFSVYLLRDRPWWLIAAVFIYILTTPIAVSAIHLYKPDILSGLLMTIGCLTALGFGHLQNQVAWKRFMWAGIFFGLSILAKAPTFPLSLFIGGCGFTLGVIQLFVFEGKQRSFRTLITWLFVFSIPVLLLSLLYFSVGWRHTLDYIQSNAMGKYKDLWAFKGNLAQAFSFYMGNDGMLGKHKWPALFLFLTAVILACKASTSSNRARLGFASLLCLITYIFISLNPMKNWEMGSPAIMFIIILPLAFFSVLLPYKWCAFSRVMVGIYTAILLLPLAWFNPLLRIKMIADSIPPDNTAIYQAILDTLKKDYINELGLRNVLFCGVGRVSHGGTLWLFSKHGLNKLNLYGTDPLSTPEQIAKSADFQDYVIVAQTAVQGQAYSYCPSNRYGDEIDAAIAAKPGMQRIGAIPSCTGKEFRIYRNGLRATAHPFYGWVNPLAFVVFPNTSHLNNIGRSASVDFTVEEAGEWRMDLGIISNIIGAQKVQVLLDGTLVETIEVPQCGVSVPANLLFTVAPGHHRISFQPSVIENHPHQDGKLASIEFNRLALYPSNGVSSIILGKNPP